MPQIFLWNVIVVNPAVGNQGFPEIVCRGESCLLDKLLYTSIKSLDHAVRLRMAWFYKAMLDIAGRAFQVKRMVTGGFPFPGNTGSVGEFLAIIRQDFGYKKGIFF